ncbi:MAG TPA: M24 family metallopeptidase [Bacteroidales bacterium]|nr:M24 family metallopeptidase [Bacteroidales bacterium]
MTRESFSSKLRKLEIIIDRSPSIDRYYSIPADEFIERRRKTWNELISIADIDVAFAFSDEHYSGDVPYLGGNINYSIEQVAFGLGPDPLSSGIIAGFEGVYIAGQLASRAAIRVYPTESLQLADEKYPVEGFSLKDILETIAGHKIRRIGLLSPRQVIPAGIIANLEEIAGKDNVIDTQGPFQKVKNLKSDNEMKLIEDAGYITSLALRAMLAVTEPGMDETEVAAFGDMLAKWMGCERQGFQTMVGSDTACATMIGPALNRPIAEGEFMHLGTSYKRDGLTACCRRSIFSGKSGSTSYREYFRKLVEEGFVTGIKAYADIAKNDKPAKIQEKALIDFFNSRTDEMLGVVQEKYGKTIASSLRDYLYSDIPGITKGLARMKPYTGTHNSGYTECQEFYGAITLDSEEPLEKQVVTMLDVALRGRGSKWLGVEFEKIIPDFDYWVVEDTLGKYGNTVKNLTGELQPGGRIVKGFGKIPVNVQSMVGNINEYTA